MDRREFVIRTALAAMALAGTILLLAALWVGRTLFLLAFAGVLLAVFLGALARQVQRLGLAYRPALVLVMLFLLLAAAGLGIWVGPSLARQLDIFISWLPQAISSIETSLGRYGWGQWLLQTLGDQVTGEGANFLSGVTNVFSRTFGGMGAVVVVLFLGIYLAMSPRVYMGGFLALLPPARRPEVEELIHVVGHNLERWLLGTALAMVTVGILSGIGFAIIGLPLVLTLATIAMLFTFIPYAGPVLSAIPALIVAFVTDPLLALYVLLFYTAVQTMEGYLLTPLIQRKASHIPPALLIMAQVLAALLFGFLGLLLATPATAILLAVVRHKWIKPLASSGAPPPEPG